MFSSKSIFLLEKPIQKNDFIYYSPRSLATINKISKISMKWPREDAYISLQNPYISVEFEVLKMMIEDTPTMMK